MRENERKEYDGKTTKHRRWLLPALLWLLVLAWLALNGPTLRHLLVGPTPLDLDTVGEPDPLSRWQGDYVLIDSSKLEILSPYAYTLGKQPYTSYGLLPAGNGQRLLVLAPTDHQGPQVAGILEPLSAYEQRHLLPRLREQRPAQPVLPCRLNATRPVLPIGFLMTLFPAACLAGATLWLTIRAWQRGRCQKSGNSPFPTPARLLGQY